MWQMTKDTVAAEDYRSPHFRFLPQWLVERARMRNNFTRVANFSLADQTTEV